VVWNVELNTRLTREVTLKVGHLRRRGSREFVVDPVIDGSTGRLVLDSRGESRYWEQEVTVRYTRARHDITTSYVRSRSLTDLNTFDTFFGNARAAVIRANEFSLSNIDVPHRLLVRATLGLPRRWEIVPLLELRNGFPYSAVDEEQQFVGPRNRDRRYPVFASLDLAIQRPTRILRWNTRVGLRVFNALNRHNPRDVQANVHSPAFGQFFNPVRRSLGATFWIER
jgi:hypothetical protein